MHFVFIFHHCIWGDIGEALKRIPKCKWLLMPEKSLSTISSAFSVYGLLTQNTWKQKPRMAWNGRCEGFDHRHHPGSHLGLTLGKLLNFCSPLFLHLENESPSYRPSSWEKIYDSSVANPPLPPRRVLINNLYTPAGQLCVESSFPFLFCFQLN